MKYRTIIVTGASSGIGRATARHIASMGGTVVMACPDRERGERARKEMIAGIESEGKQTARHGSLELGICDLSSMDSVEQFAVDFEKRHSELHVLVNCAGTWRRRRAETAEGIELHFAVNYLGHFFLTCLLLDRLRRSAPSRVVNVTCREEARGRVHFKDLNVSRFYTSRKAYAQSKRALVLFTRELARRNRESGVTANSVDPGPTATRLGVDRETGAGARLARLRRITRQDTFRGATSVIRLAVDPDLRELSGRHFVGSAEAAPGTRRQSPGEGRRLWEASARLIGLE